jgi:hypothetical protein
MRQNAVISAEGSDAERLVAAEQSRAVCHDILHFSARVLVGSTGQFRQFGHGRLTRSLPEP